MSSNRGCPRSETYEPRHFRAGRAWQCQARRPMELPPRATSVALVTSMKRGALEGNPFRAQESWGGGDAVRVRLEEWRPGARHSFDSWVTGRRPGRLLSSFGGS